MNCPDCGFTLRGDTTKCRCGWVNPASQTAPAERPFCATGGCDQRAQLGNRLCVACEARIRQAQADAFCASNGLKTIDDKRAYCRRLLRRSLVCVPSFERWAEAIRQGTVDRLVLMNGIDDRRCLERLRDAGVIDEYNQLIPLEQRNQARTQREVERQRERAAHG